MGNDKIPVNASDYEKLLAGLRSCSDKAKRCETCSYYLHCANCLEKLHCDAADELERQRAKIDRLTAENRAKETYIAEHMGGTAERNARMKRDAERLRGTGKKINLFIYSGGVPGGAFSA